MIVTGLLTGPALGLDPAPPPACRNLPGAAVVVLGCACIVVGAISLTSDAMGRQSRGAAGEGDLARAADDARAAVAIQPWAAGPRLQLALAEEQSDPVAARRDLGKVLERAPQDWRIWVVLTRMCANAAHREWRRARPAPHQACARGGSLADPARALNAGR